MTWMFVVFLVGGMIGLMAGIAWSDALRQAERAVHERTSKEMWQEITRQRAQIANMVGREKV